MVRSPTGLAELLRLAPLKSLLSEAADHQNRIRFHSEAASTEQRASPYHYDFFRWIQNDIKLPSDKFAAFKAQCRFPVLTNGIVSSIFDEYRKVFGASDSSRTVEFTESSFTPEFEDYVKETAIPQWFAEQGLNELRTRHNSILFIDLPAQQTTPRPQPYFYSIPIEKVVHLDFARGADGTKRISGILFHSTDKAAIWADETFYRTLEKTEGGEWAETGYAVHGLGYAPAEFLNPYNLYADNAVVKKSPLSDYAIDLDWLLFLKAAKRTYETYGPFPIMSVFSSPCTFEDAQSNPCQGGRIAYMDNNIAKDRACPVCSSKSSLVGPGSILNKPTPRTKEDAQIDSAVTITSPDIASLKWISEEVDRIEWDLYESCVGGTDQALAKQAINKDQVTGSFDGKKNVLMGLKKIFEQAETFVTATFARLMYGPYFAGCTIDYGTQFQLMTAEDYALQFTNAKESGYPEFLVNHRIERFIEAETRSNIPQKLRLETLRYLEPWPNLSLQECISLQFNVLQPDKFYLKSEFAKFVSQFEMANGSITEWGSALTPVARLQKIETIIFDYVRKANTGSAAANEQSRPTNAVSGSNQQGAGQNANQGAVS